MKAKKIEIQTDLFRIDKKQRAGMFLFLAVMILVWSLPIYSLIKNSLAVNGILNYSYVLMNDINGVPFYRYFINSAINALGSSFLVVSISSMAGFAFSKIFFTGRKLIYNMILMCLAVSGPILIIPLFYIMKNIHIYNTPLAIIFAETVITVPLGVLMMKNFFDRLPHELMESANIDGAGIESTFFLIYMPLAKPAMINLFVLQSMWSLQDFLFPTMFLTNSKLYTTTVAVNAFRGAYGVIGANLGRYNASLVLITIPTILVFIFAQKFIVNGISAGSVKE